MSNDKMQFHVPKAGDDLCGFRFADRPIKCPCQLQHHREGTQAALHASQSQERKMGELETL